MPSASSRISSVTRSSAYRVLAYGRRPTGLDLVHPHEVDCPRRRLVSVMGFVPRSRTQSSRVEHLCFVDPPR